MGGLLARANANANVHPGAVQSHATVQPGAFRGTMESGAVQGNATIHSGAFRGTVDRGAVQGQATVETGAVRGVVEQGAVQSRVQADANVLGMQDGAIRGLGVATGGVNVTGTAGVSNEAVIGVKPGGILGMEENAVNVKAVGAEPGAVRAVIEPGAAQVLGMAPEAVRANVSVNSDNFTMMMVSLGGIVLGFLALVINVLPVLGPYPWMFIGGLVFVTTSGGLLHQRMKHQQEMLEAQLQSNKRMTIQAVNSVFTDANHQYNRLMLQYKDNSTAPIRQIMEDLVHDGNYFQRIYQDSIQNVNVVSDASSIEMAKSTFNDKTKEFKMAISTHEKKIGDWVIEMGRQKLMEDAEQMAKNFRNQVQELQNKYKDLSHVPVIEKIMNEVNQLADTYCNQLAPYAKAIKESFNEIQQSKIKLDLEAFTNSNLTKLEELAKKLTTWLEKKLVILDDLDSRYKGLETRFAIIQQKVPNSPEAFLDFDKMQDKLKDLKMDETWDNFSSKYQDLRRTLEQIDDSSQESRTLIEVTNLCSDFAKALDVLDGHINDLLKKYAMTDEGRLARSMKSRSRVVKRLNNLEIMKLPMVLEHKDDAKMFRHMSVGEDVGVGYPTKIIMMVGMCGAGKSLMINNIVNYVYGVNCEDNFRFKLILEEDELSERTDGTSNKAEAMTRWVTSYKLHYQAGFRVHASVILIDTPGFSDTRGVKYDEQTVDILKSFFSDQNYPINELSSIGLVIQASQARLTPEQTYVFNSVLNIFGNDVAKNICLLFTFADAQPPPALETVRKENIPFPEGGVFKFNNSAVFADNTADEATAYYWKFGFDSLRKFFRHIESIQPASLTLTKQVLDERETLHLLLDGLRKRIDNGFDQLVSIENMTKTIMQIKGTLKANRNHKVKKTVHPQETKVVNHNITNCKPCMYTCHDPCYIAGDQKQGCASMRDGKCVQCPGQCGWESHSNGDRIYIYKKVEVEETVEDMLKDYNIALNDKKAKVKLLQNLKLDYMKQKEDLFSDIRQACAAAKRLEEIALGKSLLTSVEYINRLIESERRSNRPNKQSRIEQLKAFKDKAEMLADAKQGPDKMLNKLTNYEATVMKAIKLAEAEEELEEQLEKDREAKAAVQQDDLLTKTFKGAKQVWNTLTQGPSPPPKNNATK